MDPTDAKLLDINQAAERLSLKTYTVREMCRKKLLQHMRIGPSRGLYRFRPEWLDEYLENCIVEATGPARKPVRQKPEIVGKTSVGNTVAKDFRKSLLQSRNG